MVDIGLRLNLLEHLSLLFLDNIGSVRINLINKHLHALIQVLHLTLKSHSLPFKFHGTILAPMGDSCQLFVSEFEGGLSLLRHFKLLAQTLYLFLFLVDDLVFDADLLALVENLALADIGELLSQNFALGNAIRKNEVDHAYIGIKDSFEQDAAFDALDGDLPCDLFDRDIVRNLNQKVRVCLRYLVFVDPLRWESLLGTLLGEKSLTVLMLHFDHVEDALEPLGEKNGVLPAAWLAEVGLGEAEARCFLFDILLEPLGLVFVLISPDARLGELVGKVVERLKQLLLARHVSLLLLDL